MRERDCAFPLRNVFSVTPSACVQLRFPLIVTAIPKLRGFIVLWPFHVPHKAGKVGQGNGRFVLPDPRGEELSSKPRR